MFFTLWEEGHTSLDNPEQVMMTSQVRPQELSPAPWVAPPAFFFLAEPKGAFALSLA